MAITIIEAIDCVDRSSFAQNPPIAPESLIIYVQYGVPSQFDWESRECVCYACRLSWRVCTGMCAFSLSWYFHAINCTIIIALRVRTIVVPVYYYYWWLLLCTSNTTTSQCPMPMPLLQRRETRALCSHQTQDRVQIQQRQYLLYFRSSRKKCQIVVCCCCCCCWLSRLCRFSPLLVY